MSVLEFCRSEAINPGVFRRRRSMLNGGVRVKQSQPRTKAKVVAPFIDIGAVGCLYFDRSGFCIWDKRPETGKYFSAWRKIEVINRGDGREAREEALFAF